MDTLVLGQSTPSRRRVGAEERQHIVSARNRLDRDGYVHVAAEITRQMAARLDLTGLTALAARAPLDRYDPNGLRRRFYRTGTYQPHTGRLTFDDVHEAKDGRFYVPYYQKTEINSDAAGTSRQFEPLPDFVERDETLCHLVGLVFDLIPGDLIDRQVRQAVGIHLTRLWSDGRKRAVPSPPHLHTDGEPWTAIILVDRVNCAPGSAVNYVAERRCRGMQPQDCEAEDILDVITMRQPLEMIMVDDSRVAHHVSGVHGANSEPGHRTSLLIDFSPLIPDRTA